jgi:hypothetical protein
MEYNLKGKLSCSDYLQHFSLDLKQNKRLKLFKWLAIFGILSLYIIMFISIIIFSGYNILVELFRVTSLLTKIKFLLPL